MSHEAPLLTTVAAALLAAWVLGLVAQKLQLSSIVGYLLAGIAIGPFTPGFVGDVGIASQLSEIGVVLLMFGVGLQFHVQDLIEVKGLAIPGVLVKGGLVVLVGLGLGAANGWPMNEGLVFGIALSVASTVVLLRGIEANSLVGSPAGRMAVGWLVVEDIVTVVVMVALPALASTGSASGAASSLAVAIASALFRLIGLVALVMVVGSRVVPWVLVRVARLRSRELFTLTVLAITVGIAGLAASVFGASIALGAFLAGMVVGQTKVSQQAAADALPLRDAFSVLFFVSVGMLFEPAFLLREPVLLVFTLAVVVLLKPLAAFVCLAWFGYSTGGSLFVAMGLGQIGEFSFILGSLGHQLGLVSESTNSALVAAALVSIAVNPILLAAVPGIEATLRRSPWLWRRLNATAMARAATINETTARAIENTRGPLAIIVGFGPVGQAVDRGLRHAGVETVVIDQNMDTVTAVGSRSRHAIFGDAAQDLILKAAGIERATQLIVTLPHSVNRVPLITAARQINPSCRLFVRARYLRERPELEREGVDYATFEEAEAAVALTEGVLRDLGTEPSVIDAEVRRVRAETTGAPTSTLGLRSTGPVG